MQNDSSPLNPLPPIVWVLFLAIVGIEGVFRLGESGIIGGPDAVGWRLATVQDYGFSGQVFDWMMMDGRWPLEHTMRFFTYVFVHGSFTSALFSGIMLLALGKLVGEVMGQLAVLVIFLGSAFVGALVFGLLTSEAWLVGAFPAVYGLIGGYTFIMWLRLGVTGQSQSGAFSLILMLMGIQLGFSVLFGTGPDWVADLAGFVCGFLLSIAVVPGAMTRFVQWMRHRR